MSDGQIIAIHPVSAAGVPTAGISTSAVTAAGQTVVTQQQPSQAEEVASSALTDMASSIASDPWTLDSFVLDASLVFDFIFEPFYKSLSDANFSLKTVKSHAFMILSLLYLQSTLVTLNETIDQFLCYVEANYRFPILAFF